jgi:hypothetical protein
VLICADGLKEEREEIRERIIIDKGITIVFI